MSLFDQYNWQGENGFPYYWGYYWLGPIQIPPLPVWLGLTDRITGTVYYLRFAGLSGSGGTHLHLDNTAPSKAPIKIYQPWDGPFLGQFGFRMGVSNGRLVFDTFAGDSGPGPFARNPANFQEIAGLFATNINKSQSYDHAAFLIGSATNSIFSNPKNSFFDQYNPGQGSDVVGT